MSHHTFVLSRRVGRTLPAAEAALPIVVAYHHGELRFVGQFQRRSLIGPWGSGPPERHAPAELRTGRHTVDRVEVELGPWARHAVELRMRPVAHRPERWSGRRQTRYFDRAHAAIDELARALEAVTPAPPAHLPVTRSA